MAFDFKKEYKEFYMPKKRPERVIGQNVLVKTATNVEISMGVAVLSCFRQLRGWTKCVGKTSKIG